jgi:ribosomal protein S3AE
MFTSDNYFNITNAHILNENVNHLVERENDEPDEATQFAQSDAIQRRREAAEKATKQKAGRAKLKSQGLKRKDGSSVFESVAEYLFVEGYADNVRSAEVMAMNISEDWVNEILNESEKVFPLRKVADKMRKVGGEMKSSKSPEEKAKLRTRLNKMGDQYWQPN